VDRKRTRVGIDRPGPVGGRNDVHLRGDRATGQRRRERREADVRLRQRDIAGPVDRAVGGTRDAGDHDRHCAVDRKAPREHDVHAARIPDGSAGVHNEPRHCDGKYGTENQCQRDATAITADAASARSFTAAPFAPRAKPSRSLATIRSL
jgi:hypothetical protein